MSTSAQARYLADASPPVCGLNVAGSFDKLQPFFNTARLGAVAVMIEDALAPGDTKRRIFAAREDGRVLNRNTALIVVAIERPGLQLAAGEFSIVHQQMKWVLVVIALFAYGVKAGDEFGLSEQGPIGFGSDDGHNSNSIPS